MGLVCSVGAVRINHSSLRAVVTLRAARLRRLFQMRRICDSRQWRSPYGLPFGSPMASHLSNRIGDSRPAPYYQIQKTHREGGFFVSGSKGRIRTADPNIMSVVL